MTAQQTQLELSGKPLYIGPAGWSYEDSPGIVYPENLSQAKVLNYVSQYFNTVEVNVSFYRFVTPRMSESWVRKVAGPKAFQFAYKLNQRFTHQRSEPYTSQEAREFKAGLAPAAEAGMLGALLAQFPWSFRYNDESIDHLERIRDDFGEYSLAVEVRHRTWEQPEAIERLRDLGVSLCAIDQPAFQSNMRPMDVVTGPLAYVRLHGRNAAKWFAEDIQPWERYDYMYTEEELTDWSEKIRKMAGSADRIFVIANNHYKGQGAANALQLRHMLTGQPVAVPPTMARHYPMLDKIAQPPPRQEQQAKLF